MLSVSIAKLIPLKLYGETYAEVVVYADGDRQLRVYREFWFHDETLLLADFIKEHVS